MGHVRKFAGILKKGIVGFGLTLWIHEDCDDCSGCGDDTSLLIKYLLYKP